MNRSLGPAPLEFPTPFSRRSPLAGMDDDLVLDDDFFCLSVVGQEAPLSRAMPAPGPAQSHGPSMMPTPGSSFSAAALADLPETFLPRVSAGQRIDRHIPAFVPLRQETSFACKDPWGVHTVLDLFRFFLLEMTLAAGLMAGCGLMAGRLLVRWTGTIPPMAVLGLYLGVLLLYIGRLYLTCRGGNSARMMPAMRQLVFGLFLLLLPHTVAYVLALHA